MENTSFKKTASAVLLLTFFTSSCTVNKERKAAAVEMAKTQFALAHFDKEDVPFDSVYSKKDTILFYKKGAFVGSSVISYK